MKLDPKTTILDLGERGILIDALETYVHQQCANINRYTRHPEQEPAKSRIRRAEDRKAAAEDLLTKIKDL